MSRARDLADRVLHNRTHEDTDGGRESIVTFKGEQSGGEISTLAQIQASHDGTADDQKSDLIFKTNDGSDGASPTEAARIDSQSNFLIGHSDNTNVAGHEAALQIVGQGTADYHGSTVSIVGNANNSNGAYLNFAKGRSNTAGTATAAAADDTVGQINFSAADGTDFANRVANITAQVNGGVANNDTPGRLVFATTSDGAGDVTTRLRIDEHGIKFGSDTAAANALNDYEEGTFTPVLSGYTSVTGTLEGKYTRIGRMVFCEVYMNITGLTYSGNTRITGWPFTPDGTINNHTGQGTIANSTALNVDGHLYYFGFYAKTANAYLYNKDSGGALSGNNYQVGTLGVKFAYATED